MADDGKSQQGNQTPSDDEVESRFWDKLDERLDHFFDRKLKNVDAGKVQKQDSKVDPKPEDKPDQGTSRTGGKRTTLKSLVADAVFGPPKD